MTINYELRNRPDKMGLCPLRIVFQDRGKRIIGKTVDKRGIIFGEKYIVHTKYGMNMVKFLHQATKGFVKLISYNKKIPELEIPMDDITFICRVYFIVNPS